MPERLHVKIEGQVQGVGYRYYARAKARALGLNGWIRNLPDGRVEAEFEGDQALLEQMLAWCQRGPSGAHIRNIEVSWEQAPARYDSFDIRF
jgi:acylphosphatase